MAVKNPLGLRLGGRGYRSALWWPRLLERFKNVIPPYPDSTVIQPACIPQPPQLPRESSAEADAWMLARAYTTAVTHYFGASFVFSRVTEQTIERSKHFVTLVGAAPFLRQYRIPPVAWCAFSAEAWINYSKRRHAPGVAWVYSRKRLLERQDWFNVEESKFKGGKLVISKPHRELIRRYSMMKAALLALPGEPEDLREEDVRAVVATHLPKKDYKRLVEEARDAAEEKTRDLYRSLKRGEFLW